MRTLDSFIVKLDKTRKDTLKLDNGMELYLDSKYNEFQHRVTGGEVVSTPARYDLGVEVGDTLYFHHHVVIQKGQHLGLEENDGLYVVRYDHEHTLANQAIAYKSQKTGEIKTLGGWLLLEPIEESQENEIVSGIEVVKLKKVPTKRHASLSTTSVLTGWILLQETWWSTKKGVTTRSKSTISCTSEFVKMS